MIFQIWISINFAPQEWSELCSEICFFIIQCRSCWNPVKVPVCLFGSEVGGWTATLEDVLIQPAHVSQCFPLWQTTETVPLWPPSHPLPSNTLQHNWDKSTPKIHNPKPAVLPSPPTTRYEKFPMPHPSPSPQPRSLWAFQLPTAPPPPNKSHMWSPVRSNCTDGFNDLQSHSRHDGCVIASGTNNSLRYLHISQGWLHTMPLEPSR